MSQPHLIESISDYCNSRCELCAFTERCRVFQDMRDYHRKRPDRGALEQTHDKFQEVFRLLEEWCEREGIDFDEIQRQAHSEETQSETRRIDGTVGGDPLRKLATAYTFATLKLVDALSTARRLRSWPGHVEAAIDTIAWNAGMVGAKVHRALHGFASRGGWLDEDTVQNDWNGSAKIARLVVQESKEAWRVVMEAGEAAPDSPLTELVALLDRVDAGLEERFPRAMEFIRPGFDEPRVATLMNK